MNNEFAARFPISENVSLMLNFSVIHHFGKLTVNACFFAVQVIVTWKDLGTRLVRTKPPSLFRSSATMAQLLSRSVLLTNYHTEHLVCTASLIVSGRDHQKPGVSKPMKGQGLEGSK